MLAEKNVAIINIILVATEVLIAVTMKRAVVWNVMLCCLVEVHNIKFEVFMTIIKKAVLWDIKTEFVNHRKHITYPLQSPAS
jgi:hypothetical protein